MQQFTAWPWMDGMTEYKMYLVLHITSGTPTIEDGILLQGNRIYIPPVLYERTLHDLHGSHKGIEKMQHLARAHFCWPRIDANILDYMRRYTTCTRYKATQAVQPMLPRDIPDRPWQELATDYFTHNGKEHILIAEPFSKYPFIFRTRSKTSDSLVQCLQYLIS